MTEPKWIELKCIKIQQPIGEFYIGVLDSKWLLEVSYTDIIHIEHPERNVESVSGLERPLSMARVKELREYVKASDATFPTGVILAVSSDDATFDEASSTMRLRNSRDVAQVIDGQHRIEGLRNYSGPTFQVNVTIFVDMDEEDQAMVFSIINLKQAPVNKSITYELFEYARSRSPQKTCHSIAKALNAEKGSPFMDKIMILGVAHDKDKETLTQAAFIKPLLKLITTEKKALEDRNILKNKRMLTSPTDEEVRHNKWVFRRWFIAGDDTKIAQTVGNYFSAVSAKWPQAWNEKTRGLILNRTNGYNSLMRFLPLVLFRLGLGKVHSIEDFKQVIDRIKLKDEDFSPERFSPGSTGESLLLQRYLLDSGIKQNEQYAQVVAGKAD